MTNEQPPRITWSTPSGESLISSSSRDDDRRTIPPESSTVRLGPSTETFSINFVGHLHGHDLTPIKRAVIITALEALVVELRQPPVGLRLPDAD